MGLIATVGSSMTYLFDVVTTSKQRRFNVLFQYPVGKSPKKQSEEVRFC